MMTLLSARFRRRACRPHLEELEGRLAPAGNLLVSTQISGGTSYLVEFTPAGQYVSDTVIPPGAGKGEGARDLVVDSKGAVQVFNGLNDPYLSAYAGGAWTHRTLAGWSTQPTSGYGGVATLNNVVFATDMNTTAQAGDTPRGLIRFVSGGTITRFETGVDFTDVAGGLDGKLYGYSAGLKRVFVYDPNTLQPIRNFALPATIAGQAADYRGLAVNAAGTVYAVTASNYLCRFSGTGALQGTFQLPPWQSIGNAIDLDLSADGVLAFGTTTGAVGQLTESFGGFTAFDTYANAPVYVAFKPYTPPPPPPKVIIGSDVTVSEGLSGYTYVSIPVSLSAPSSQDVYVDVTTVDGTATAGSDYVAQTRHLYFPAGYTSAGITVPVIGDNVMEYNEAFTVVLSNPVNATLDARTQAAVNVMNDDFARASLNPGNVAVNEGNGGTTAVTFTMTLSCPAAFEGTMYWGTQDSTAVAGSDYVGATGGVTFAPYETSKTFTVTVLGDTAVEADERFYIWVNGIPSAPVAAGPSNYVTIVNDDVPNQAPVANAGPDQTANEGSSVAFDATGSTDPDGDALTFAWDFGDGQAGSGATPAHVYRDNGTYTVTLTVGDGRGGSATDTLAVTVNNLAPTAVIQGPAFAVTGEPLIFTFSATDPGPVDAYGFMDYTLDFGDGAHRTLNSFAVGFRYEHTYAQPGTYQVTLTATDKDGATGGTTTFTLPVSVVTLQGGDLYVGGTPGNDAIAVTALGGGAVNVAINGADQGNFTLGLAAPGTGSVAVFAGDGDDQVVLVGTDDGAGQVAFPFGATLLGGQGNNVLDARAATGLVLAVGGGGDDVLWGGRGRNFLIGGAGADVIHGGPGEDLIITGSTRHDHDFFALTQLAAEWGRPDADFNTRVQHLSGQQAGGYNYNAGAVLRPGDDVYNDYSVDQVDGGTGADWVFLSGTSGTDPFVLPDVLTDQDGSDLVTVL